MACLHEGSLPTNLHNQHPESHAPSDGWRRGWFGGLFPPPSVSIPFVGSVSAGVRGSVFTTPCDDCVSVVWLLSLAFPPPITILLSLSTCGSVLSFVFATPGDGCISGLWGLGAVLPVSMAM